MPRLQPSAGLLPGESRELLINARISLLTISHMMGELEKSTGRRIDLVEDGCLLPFAVESANRDKILIYERRG